MKLIELFSILAIGICATLFGANFLEVGPQLRPIFYVAAFVFIIAVATGYYVLVSRNAAAAEHRLLPVLLRLLLSLSGLGCVCIVGWLFVYFAFYSESDASSGNAQLAILYVSVGALLLITLWLYGRRIFRIARRGRTPA